jgi:hypothetical protein
VPYPTLTNRRGGTDLTGEYELMDRRKIFANRS